MRLATYTPNTCVMQMQDFEEQILKQLAVEQVTHVPLDEYKQGQPRMEKLYQQMADAQRFGSASGEVNL